MKQKTRQLWQKQDQHEGDRWRLFSAVSRAFAIESVLYPGSYVDIAPSFVFPAVTYLDVDKRAAAFFSDREGVLAIIRESPGSPKSPAFSFLHSDYTEKQPLPLGTFDLLVSLYAGFISEHCTEYLALGGYLLANPSHGDVAMASLDPRYKLAGVIMSKQGAYSVKTTDLDTYLIPKRPESLDIDKIRSTCRGVVYTKSAFAYLFQRVS
jgi:hypothetical protein